MRDLAGRMGVRARLTLVSVVVVGVVLAVGGWLLVWAAGNRVEDAVIDAAESRLEGLVAFAGEGLDDPLPGSDAELISQVIGADGDVLAADRILAGVPALVDRRVAPGERVVFESDDLLEPFEGRILEDEGPYRVFVEGVALPGGDGLVLVAASLEPASDARRAVVPLLLVGLPALLIVLGAVTWLLTGLALRPVERMRVEAVGISAADPGRRLPVPVPADEIRALAESLNDMLGRLEGALVRQRQFVADASHELKSPLAAFQAVIDVALDDPDPAVRAAARADLAGEVARMERLVSGMLVLATSEEGAPALRRVEVDLDQVAGREAAAARRRSGCEVDARRVEPARVSGDPDRLAQLVRNLVDNALRHAETRIWLATRVDGDQCVLAVGDDGPGVAPADRERIFERFVRLDDSRARDTGGAGLGLAVARAIARSHGGDLAVVDGSVFELRLPAVA